MRGVNEENVSDLGLARLARSREASEIILTKQMPAKGGMNDAMLRSVATLTQRFAVCVWILPRQTTRHVELVMHLKSSAIRGAAAAAPAAVVV
jgi:hypothetical protein